MVQCGFKFSLPYEDISVCTRNKYISPTNSYEGPLRLCTPEALEGIRKTRRCIMSKHFKKLSHTIYECKYHLVCCPKYRHRILKDEIEKKQMSFFKYTSNRVPSRRLSENGYFPQSQRQTQIIVLEILQCIPVVIIFAFLDLGKNFSFSDGP
jgi:hypothetical protein